MWFVLIAASPVILGYIVWYLVTARRGAALRLDTLSEARALNLDVLTRDRLLSTMVRHVRIACSGAIVGVVVGAIVLGTVRPEMLGIGLAPLLACFALTGAAMTESFLIFASSHGATSTRVADLASRGVLTHVSATRLIVTAVLLAGTVLLTAVAVTRSGMPAATGIGAIAALVATVALVLWALVRVSRVPRRAASRGEHSVHEVMASEVSGRLVDYVSALATLSAMVAWGIVTQYFGDAWTFIGFIALVVVALCLPWFRSQVDERAAA